MIAGPLQALNTFIASIAIVGNNPEPVPANRYTELDMIYNKLSIAREYVLLVERAPNQTVKDRLMAREAHLFEFLQSENWESIRRGRLLLREMKDDIYPERLKEALRAGQTNIRMDPDIAYEMASLEFCLCFQNTLLDASAAKEEWTCRWRFGDGLTGSGWTVSHYFQLPRRNPGRTFHIEVELYDSEGNAITNEDNSKLVAQRDVQVHPSDLRRGFGERSVIESFKLSAALLFAVFGLVTGARDQLAKLDVLPGLVAVFLVGFSADTIKNLLAPKEVKVATK